MTAKTKQTFYNYVVGEPYQDISLAMTDQDVYNHRREYLPRAMTSKGKYKHVAIGIDWGKVLPL